MKFSTLGLWASVAARALAEDLLFVDGFEYSEFNEVCYPKNSPWCSCPSPEEEKEYTNDALRAIKLTHTLKGNYHSGYDSQSSN
jgi:hypothetical protein